ncbi:MAG: hypothetical protein ACPF9Y_03585, partial [Candidatus Puniceispirillaceae bacterium]
IHTNHGGGDAPLLPADFAADQDAAVRSGGCRSVVRFAPMFLAAAAPLPGRMNGINRRIAQSPADD